MDYEKQEKKANRIMAAVMLGVIVIFMIFQVVKGGDKEEDAGAELSPTPTAEAVVH